MALAVMVLDPNAQEDMTGEEIRDAIIGLDDDVRIIIISRPTPGKHKCYAMQRDDIGKLEVEYDDVPES